jgi:hypothetical protein
MACIGYLVHPFEKDGLGLLDHSHPLTRNTMEERGNQFFWLDGERKTPSGKHNADVLAACALGNHRDAKLEVFFRRHLDQRR